MKNFSTGSFVLRKGRVSSLKSALSAKVSKAVRAKVIVTIE
jgi:hypothetical protein